MLIIQQVLRNEKGENVLNDFFDSIVLKNDFIVVKRNNLFGIYDSITFKQILKCEWEKITFDRKCLIARRKEKIAVFNLSGESIFTNPNCDKVKMFENGILATVNGKQGFIKYDGTILLNCEWKRIEPYPQILLAYKGDGTRGIKFNYDGLEKNNFITLK